jgi:hypothetical protein
MSSRPDSAHHPTILHFKDVPKILEMEKEVLKNTLCFCCRWFGAAPPFPTHSC